MKKISVKKIGRSYKIKINKEKYNAKEFSEKFAIDYQQLQRKLNIVLNKERYIEERIWLHENNYCIGLKVYDVCGQMECCQSIAEISEIEEHLARNRLLSFKRGKGGTDFLYKPFDSKKREHKENWEGLKPCTSKESKDRIQSIDKIKIGKFDNVEEKKEWKYKYYDKREK